MALGRAGRMGNGQELNVFLSVMVVVAVVMVAVAAVVAMAAVRPGWR